MTEDDADDIVYDLRSTNRKATQQANSVVAPSPTHDPRSTNGKSAQQANNVVAQSSKPGVDERDTAWCKRLLEENGFSLDRQEEDGNCFFHSIATTLNRLHGTEYHTHWRVRQAIC